MQTPVLPDFIARQKPNRYVRPPAHFIREFVESLDDETRLMLLAALMNHPNRK